MRLHSQADHYLHNVVACLSRIGQSKN